MEAFFISPITIFFIGLLSAVLGIVIGWYWKKTQEGTWKEDYLAMEKEHNALKKKAKKVDKDNNRFKKQLDTWKEKVNVLEEELTTTKNQLKTETSTAKETIQTKDTTIRQLESTNQNLKSNYERLENAHAKLNTKYKEDLVDLKEWRKNKAGYNRATKDLKSRLKISQEKVNSLTTTNAKLAKEIEENSAFISKLRALKARSKKLQEDLTYWEKKHYDCHHELATLKEKMEGIEAKNQELELQTKSAAQTQQSMQQKVLEFKTRFVNINDKYHKLVESNKSSIN